MKRRYKYIGCFFDFSDFMKKIEPLNKKHLSRMIQNPHITFIYRPAEVEETFFGVEINATIVGYGNDGENEGVKVEISCAVPEIQKMANEIDIPHITISVSEQGKPVNTRKLNFEEVCPIPIRGKFGGYLIEPESQIRIRQSD